MNETTRDVLKIGAGVFLGMMTFWFVTTAIPLLMPPSAEERAAWELLQRQFEPVD